MWSWPTRGVAKAPSDELVLFRLRSTQNMERAGDCPRTGVCSPRHCCTSTVVCRARRSRCAEGTGSARVEEV